MTIPRLTQEGLDLLVAVVEDSVGGKDSIAIDEEVDDDGIDDGASHLDDDLGWSRLERSRGPEGEGVQEGRDRDIADLPKGRRLDLREGAGVERPPDPGAVQALEQQSGQSVGTVRFQDEEGMAAQGPEDPEVDADNDLLGATDHRHDLVGWTVANRGCRDADRPAAHLGQDAARLEHGGGECRHEIRLAGLAGTRCTHAHRRSQVASEMLPFRTRPVAHPGARLKAGELDALDLSMTHRAHGLE